MASNNFLASSHQSYPVCQIRRFCSRLDRYVGRQVNMDAQTWTRKFVTNFNLGARASIKTGPSSIRSFHKHFSWTCSKKKGSNDLCQDLRPFLKTIHFSQNALRYKAYSKVIVWPRVNLAGIAWAKHFWPIVAIGPSFTHNVWFKMARTTQVFNQTKLRRMLWLSTA